MQKNFLALCLLASVSIMPVQAMDKNRVVLEDDDTSSLLATSTNETSKSSASFVQGPLTGEDIQLKKDVPRSIADECADLRKNVAHLRQEADKKKNINVDGIALEEKLAEKVILAPSLSPIEKKSGFIPSLCGVQWLVQSATGKSLATTVQPLAAGLFKSVQTIPAIKHAIALAAPKATALFNYLAASKIGVLASMANTGFLAYAPAVYGLYVISKTTSDVVSGFQDPKDAQNRVGIGESQFNKYCDALKINKEGQFSKFRFVANALVANTLLPYRYAYNKVISAHNTVISYVDNIPLTSNDEQNEKAK